MSPTLLPRWVFRGLKSTTGINAKAKLDFRPTADDLTQLTFSRTDKRLTPQARVSAINIINLGYKRTMTPALSAVITISDLFDAQRYQRSASMPTLTQVYERSVLGRTAWLGLPYTIGVMKMGKQTNFVRVRRRSALEPVAGGRRVTERGSGPLIGEEP